NERGWDGTFAPESGYHFTRTVRGVSDTVRLSADSIRSPDARRLHGALEWMNDIFTKPVALTDGEKDLGKANGPAALYDKVLENGRKGLAISRYKGLGEMNPEQLWETTLDPNARTLLQVR